MINNGVKPANAILFSAFIFGIVHLNPWQFIGAFLLGIVLEWFISRRNLY